MWGAIELAPMWEEAWQDTLQGNRVRGMAHEILCALCQSSLISLSHNISPKLLAMVVNADIYTPMQALVIMRQMISASHKVSAIKEFIRLDKVNPVLRQEILEFSRSMQDHFHRAAALQAIAEQSKGETRTMLLEEALESVRYIEFDYQRVTALQSIAKQSEGEMRGRLLQETCDLARSMKGSHAHDEVLRDITPLLPIEQALEIARSILTDDSRVDVLRKISKQREGELSRALLQEATDIAHSIQNSYARSKALQNIAEESLGERRITLLEEALNAIYAIENIDLRFDQLQQIAPLLPLAQALQVARSLRQDFARVHALTAIAARSEGEVRTTILQEALESARVIQDDYYRAGALVAIAAQSAGKTNITLLQEALEVARAIQDDNRRFQMLQGIAPHSEGEARITLLREVLEHNCFIWEEDNSLVYALLAIAAQSEGKVRSTFLWEIFQIARPIRFEDSRIGALLTIVEKSDGEIRTTILEEILEVAYSTEDLSLRTYILKTICRGGTHYALRKGTGSRSFPN